MIFKKKFKVRVNHYYKNKYVIEYAYYYLFPIYVSLKQWVSSSYLGDTEGWYPVLETYEYAEEIAKTFKSIEDVYQYNEKDIVKSRQFYKEKNDYVKENIPYKTKKINN